MSTNNFPLVWNSEADDGLLGSLFEKNLLFPENFSNQDSNAYANDTMFGKESLFFTPEYISKNIDFVKLVELINNRKDIVFDYEKYIGHSKRQVIRINYTNFKTSEINGASVVPDSYTETETYETENPLLSETFGNRELQLEGKLNTTKAVVNITKDSEQDYTGGLEFEFDLSKKIAIYKLHYYYLGKSRVFESDNHKNNIAFTISSTNFEDFEELLKIAELGIGDPNFKTKIEKQFLNAIKTASYGENSNNEPKYNYQRLAVLNWVYENIPEFVAAKLDFSEVVKNIFMLNLWDRFSMGDDSTKSITKVLSFLNPKTVYNYFYAKPDKLIDLLSGFDNEQLIESFCNYLTTITLIYNPPKIDEIRKFSITPNQHIETNILNGDQPGKVELTNELQLPTNYGPLGLIQLFSNDIETNNPKKQSNQFHPLDIISISCYDENLKVASEVPAIALYGKYLGDKSEWNDVIDITLALVDIVSIAVSGGALATGIKGVARIIALTDIAVATVNLSLLNSDLKNELNKSEAGRWFVSNWPIISFGIGLGTISYYLAKGILKYGPQVRQQIKNDEKLVKQIDDLEKESKKVAEISEGAGSTKFITLEKHLDDFGKLKNVTKYEDEIRKLDYEDAQFFDDEGRVLSESFSQKSKNSVSFGKDDLEKIIKNAGGNPRKVILSHNHPTSTGISAEDIKIVFDLQFGGIRAIAKDGNNYFLKKIGNMSDIDFYKTTSNVAKKVRAENPDVVKKVVLDRNSKESKKLAQLLVDGLVDELIKLKEIEYIKYQ